MIPKLGFFFACPRLCSHYVVTGPLRWPWVRLSLFSNAVQSHKRRSRSCERRYDFWV